MDPDIVAKIHERLAAVERDETVVIPLAVESGSRAWGFPSPDSDYDCRFVYVRRPEDYLSPWRKRDVIETPLDKIFDVNGWDLAKALQLLLKGNAVIIEWLRSPIIYRMDEDFAARFLELAREAGNRQRIFSHYLHLGERQRRVYFADRRSVKRKKVFHALHPAAALRWLRLRPDSVVPPMNLPEILEGCEVPRDVMAIIEALLVEKAVTNELGEAPLDPTLGAFIDSEFALAREVWRPADATWSPQAQARAEAFFLQTLDRCW
jgi:hypothetical protein